MYRLFSRQSWKLQNSPNHETGCHIHLVPLEFDGCYRDVYQITKRWYKSSPIFCGLETSQDLTIYHLSHRGEDKMATILQNIFFNSYEFGNVKI